MKNNYIIKKNKKTKKLLLLAKFAKYLIFSSFI